MDRRKTPKWFSELIPHPVADSTLFKFTIHAGGQSLEIDMKTDLDIDPQIIQEQLEDVPSVFAYWGAIHSELKSNVALLERRIKARRGILADKLTKEAMQVNVKMTDKQVQTIIEADEELNILEARHLLAEKHAGKAWYMVEAIRMKSDNLRSLAGFVKAEMNQHT